MPFTIRDFRPQDLAELWRIDQECFEPGISYSRAELEHYIRRRGAFTLVAEQPGNGDQPIAGFIVVEADRRGLGHIVTIDVRNTARRHGLGSRLMIEAERRLQKLGCSAVYLETAVDNRPAIAFYKRLGYFVVKTVPRYYQNKMDALLMGKELV